MDREPRDHWARGRLRDIEATPDTGERFETLATFGGVVVEQILSAATGASVDAYDQAQDEWVVVLAGAATLEVDDANGPTTVDLGPGDWLFLPAHTPHRVMATEAGTNWIAVHLHP